MLDIHCSNNAGWMHMQLKGVMRREYDRSSVLQMIGRAGRPQFDTEGIAVIMTQREVLE